MNKGVNLKRGLIFLVLMNISFFVLFSFTAYAGNLEIISEPKTIEIDNLELSKCKDELSTLGLGNTEFDTCFKNQLDDDSKAIYDFIVSNESKLKTGTESIVYTPENYNFVSQEAFLNDVLYAFAAIDFDRQDLYWFDISGINISYQTMEKNHVKTVLNLTIGLKKGRTSYFHLPYTNATEVFNDYNKMNTEINNISKNVADLSRYDKILYFNDYLVDRNEYNRYVNTNEINKLAYMPVSSFIYGSTLTTNKSNPVCESYSRGLKLLCDKENIPCILITGNGHMWNAVQMDDGNWYQTDVTYNDPIWQGKPSPEEIEAVKSIYLLVGNNTITKNNKTFYSDHAPSNNFNIYGSSYLPCIYPIFSNERYEDKVIIIAGDGDMDDDSILSANDAAIIMQYLEGKITLSDREKEKADINADGEVNDLDAKEILEGALSIK